MEKAALISVSDRSGLVEFAQCLSQAGYHLLTTSGSGKHLSAAGLKVASIEDYTGQREILDGRVKTLHPKIHAGLLAKRSDPAHVAQLEAEGIWAIDVAVVNLYPFVEGLNSERAQDPKQMVELIDIGGPTMIRGAAKNFAGVMPVIDPADYPRVAELIQAGKLYTPEALDLRRELAVKVFTWLANYNLEIARYFSGVTATAGNLVRAPEAALPTASPVTGMVLTKGQELRYGENPHQRAAFYRPVSSRERSWEQLNGKELSYNNLLDFDAALKLIRAFADDKPTVAITKHTNPCGVAVADSLIEALQQAKRSDPRSHFGGILAFNREVTVDVAEEIRGDFAEVVLAPAFNADALALLKSNKNLRVLKIDLKSKAGLECRSIEGGYLLQEADPGVSAVVEAQIVSKRKPTAAELKDLQFAWTLTAQVKSNAIVLAKNLTLCGSGSGQMSRIDSVELAIHKAQFHGHDLKGAVAGSDAFFPFPDSVESLAKVGVSAIVAPGGAKRDPEVIAAADALGISLLHVNDRHFRH